jgi:uncharacterized RmlC-like cupin family protein
MSASDEVVVVHPEDLDSNTGQSPGLLRLEAVSGATVGSRWIWMGYSLLAPGLVTGVHHHGESETALFILKGRGRWWIGENLSDPREAGPGDFVFIPPNVVHYEENCSDSEGVQMIVARSTQEAIVVNLDDGPGHEMGATPLSFEELRAMAVEQLASLK